MRSEDASLTGLDRRECHRRRFFCEVEITTEAGTQRGRLADISPDGMLIEAETLLSPGTEFRARVLLEKDSPLEAECAVKRLVLGAGKAMGVSFTDLKPADALRLRKLVDTLPH